MLPTYRNTSNVVQISSSDFEALFILLWNLSRFESKHAFSSVNFESLCNMCPFLASQNQSNVTDKSEHFKCAPIPSSDFAAILRHRIVPQPSLPRVHAFFNEFRETKSCSNLFGIVCSSVYLPTILGCCLIDNHATRGTRRRRVPDETPKCLQMRRVSARRQRQHMWETKGCWLTGWRSLGQDYRGVVRGPHPQQTTRREKMRGVCVHASSTSINYGPIWGNLAGACCCAHTRTGSCFKWLLGISSSSALLLLHGTFVGRVKCASSVEFDVRVDEFVKSLRIFIQTHTNFKIFMW